MKLTWEDYNYIAMFLAEAHPEIDFPGDVDDDLVIQIDRKAEVFRER